MIVHVCIVIYCYDMCVRLMSGDLYDVDVGWPGSMKPMGHFAQLGEMVLCTVRP